MANNSSKFLEIPKVSVIPIRFAFQKMIIA